MNEPRRLFDESTSPVERALLEAGASYRSPASTRDGTLAALGLVGSATLTVGAAGAASTSFLARLGVAKIVTIVATVGVVSAVPVGVYLSHHRAPAPAAPTASAAQTPAPPATVIEPTAVPAPEETPSTAQPAAEPPSSGRASRSEPKPTASAALAEEISALDAARSALARGDAPEALSLLDAYGREHPRGRMQLEAEVLRIDALAKSGRTAEAKERARLFLQRHPNSVLASRVRATLDH